MRLKFVAIFHKFWNKSIALYSGNAATFHLILCHTFRIVHNTTTVGQRRSGNIVYLYTVHSAHCTVFAMQIHLSDYDHNNSGNSF